MAERRVLILTCAIVFAMAVYLSSAWLAAAQFVTALGQSESSELWALRTSSGLSAEVTPAEFRAELLRGMPAAPGFSAPRLSSVGAEDVSFVSYYRGERPGGITPFFMFSMALEDGRWRLYTWTNVVPRPGSVPERSL